MISCMAAIKLASELPWAFTRYYLWIKKSVKKILMIIYSYLQDLSNHSTTQNSISRSIT